MRRPEDEHNEGRGDKAFPGLETAVPRNGITTGALRERYYPAAKGWVDGSTEFCNLIRAHLTSASQVLDVGAGSGRGYCHPYRGSVARLVGVDIAPEVLDNPHLDEAFCCDARHLPFGDAEFDVAFSDHVLEHLPEPPAVIREVYRVLKPGGYFFLRTPNRWHYVTMAASILPNWVHSPLVSRLTHRHGNDVFPKFYRCNTEPVVRSTMENAGFAVEQLRLVEKEPSYLERSAVLFRVGVLYERVVNGSELLRFLRSSIVGVFQKRQS